ncbi:tRNA-specific 2-thiouridylase MnmA [Candidatus Gullanella endobia]|uniref:tRNA-specific 2-thiouridylase MnmA n=1 Tax=Candidatus Gullanella endobia TaxID=1070130 RepID=A0A143WRT2_9ENTR|nr:tRNA-specific 2-thiouridylase MnmA [Candidatus Gullanella endobia]
MIKKKVIIGMSGGVDSSVSAWFLQQQGYLVEGVFMKNWEEDDNEKYCTAENDLNDVRMVCNSLGITLHTVNFSAEYWDNVFTNFLDEYQAGRTPNPDVICNKEIKFKVFLDFAIDDLGADYIATGHYVRCANVNGKTRLLRALDKNKDQSYFLYTLSYIQLARCLFPIGELIKLKVRHIAAELGFITAKKKDSTGICFIGKRNFRDFLGQYLPAQPGTIMSVNGQEIGHHQGLIYYTIGQRKGLRIGGMRDNGKEPWYVVEKDLDHNRLIVAQGKKNPWLMSTGFIVSQLHWVERKPLTKPLRCVVKTRYRQPDIGCVIMPKTDGYFQVTFDKPITSVTPGQSAVFYLKEHCLGGGIIEARKPLKLLKYI